uniref:Uncharacterized protein n=1 Tax=Arundo donax TaxID=35708 RepID=A0A0A9T2W9_ARUDO
MPSTCTSLPSPWVWPFEPEPRVKAAAAERPLVDGGRVWLLLLVIAGCAFGGLVVAAFRACVEDVGRRIMPPRVPGRRGHAGRRATGWRTLVPRLCLIWACVYCFPAVVCNYMAAMAKGGDLAAT